METKTNAIVLIVIVMILLLIAILFKIKSDKKRKSLAISYAEREKDINKVKNVPQGKKSILAGIPSWVSALLTLILTTVIMFLIGEEVVPHIIKGNKGDAIPYILYGVVVTVCCFFIVKENPRSIWYVPIICNVIVIHAAITAPNFWITKSMWIPMCGGLVLSIITSIIGARVGNRKAISDIH